MEALVERNYCAVARGHFVVVVVVFEYTEEIHVSSSFINLRIRASYKYVTFLK